MAIKTQENRRGNAGAFPGSPLQQPKVFVMPETSEIELLRWGISIIVPAISGLCGVVVGALLTARREKLNRKHGFLSKQLTDLYSPLLVIRRELKAWGELRLRISQTANREWGKLCDRFEGQPDELRKLTETRSGQFEKIIDYNNDNLKNEALPSYKTMIQIIRDNMWLAEKSTLQHFPALIEYVDIWNRFMANTIPGEVVNALGHSEESLFPFYDDIQKNHDKIRAQLA